MAPSDGSRGWLYHPVFPPGWARASLYSLARWHNGLAFKNIDFTDTGDPVVKIVEIKDGITNQTKFTAGQYDQKHWIRPGDLLFSWSGQPESSIDAFWWRGPDGWLNQHIFKVEPVAGVDRIFFFYMLRYLKPLFVGIARNKQTTGLGHVTKKDLEAMHVGVPDANTQGSIVRVLQPLDAKIDLNQCMNQTLDAMARAHFRNWFLDFDPVRARAESRPLPDMHPTTRALFPDGFVESEFGEIPRGWRHSPLYNCATWVNGAAYRDFQFCAPGEGLPIVKIAELKAGITGQTRFTHTNPGDKYLIDTGDVLFSWSGNPDTSIDTFVWSRGKGWLNQHIFKVIAASRQERTFVLWLLRHLRPVFAEIARNKQTTGLGHVTAGDMRRLNVVVPDPHVLAAFDELIGPINDLMLARELESATLARLRDELLPKLLSGELRVRDADRIVERAV